MKQAIAWGAALAVITASASFAVAADFPFKNEIHGRQGLMQLQGFNLGILAAMAKGEREYDAKLATLSAKNLELAASVDQSAMWPKGSDLTNPELDKKTAAKAALWKDMDELHKDQKTLLDAATKLAAVAGNGVDGLKAGVGEAGKACKGCHDEYRQKP